MSGHSRAAVADQRPLGDAISRALPRVGAVSVSAFDRVVAAVDASHYLLTPRAVVTPDGISEVAALLAYAVAAGESVTFRSGGTSLSGQGSTRNILVDTRRHFRDITVLDEGGRVRVGPGATVRQVNARLARHGRKLGPDPASEIACTIGGVIANNSSGMACGIAHNAYRTIESAVIVLPSGTVVDTSSPGGDNLLRSAEPQIWQTLTALRSRLMADPHLEAEVRRQFSLKNTMGYSLNALIDHATPLDILLHLMVGSEGTLGFVAEATFRTVPAHGHAATTLLVFGSLRDATDALVEIVAGGPATIELLDAASLRAARTDPESAGVLPELDIDEHCALLVEYQARGERELDALVDPARALFATLPTVVAPLLTSEPAARAALWHVRKGLYATIAGARPSGTTALLEDIAVPVESLSSTCEDLRELFHRHGYRDAVIFGHAKDGNVHFLITEDFEDPESLQRYRAFTEEMVDLVLAAGGTLKAEHGTGKIMAPFVERQYGAELYGMMKEIKSALDPAGVLNPDTVLTTDPDLHLRDLKTTPSVEEEVDRCVECGYCEPACPSKDLTTTPRQRIVARRGLAAAVEAGDDALAAQLRRDERYQVVETCAVDGMCQTACPVLINTGDLVRRLRSDSVGTLVAATWNAAGARWKPVTRAAAAALTVAKSVPAPLVTIPNVAARAVLGSDVVPLWTRDLPRGGRRRETDAIGTPADVVLFQACVGAMFGAGDGGTGATGAFLSLAQKAGVRVVRPVATEDLCCGTPWKSKGIAGGYDAMVQRTLPALWEASDGGSLPIVCDNSSCSEGLVLALEKVVSHSPEYPGLTIVDAVDVVAERFLPLLEVDRALRTVAVHPTCSSTRAGSNTHLLQLAQAFADDVTVPDDWGCCAFAGDRGMLHPELTASATSAEASEVRASEYDAYVSCNRTCEIGMSRATGRPYQHVLEVLDAHARRLPNE